MTPDKTKRQIIGKGYYPNWTVFNHSTSWDILELEQNDSLLFAGIGNRIH